MGFGVEATHTHISDNQVSMSTPAAGSSSSMMSINNQQKNKGIEQFNADARLMAEFEQSGDAGKDFDYSRSSFPPPESVPEEQMTAYLSKIQRGGLIQAFGCMFVVEEPSFKIIGFSENCVEMLGVEAYVESKQLTSLIGVDVRVLFTPPSTASMAKAAAAREISMLNPLWVYSRNTQKPFYAILHRIDVGIVIDLEPARSGDPALSLAGAVQSQKLAVRAISRLQSLPGGDIGLLCDTVVEDVQRLTGYDRVMVYKFHDDDHGEVVSEIRRSDLEPYLGLHYPATDIPQAARFLFKQNRVRMICDCYAVPVKVVQSEKFNQSLCLVNSTLRSPHQCHTMYMANMGSVASLVMAVVISETNSTKLWGLLVCHHTSPRYVPFPLRYAGEFLMQSFGLQLNMELQLAAQLDEKKILKTQTLLCDMLLRDAPSGIVTQSPSIMDIVKCDGAALYYKGTSWLLGVTPTESQLKDIVQWLIINHGDSTGLSTDSLANAGYPGAALLGDAVCGMAVARISSNDFLFWFRSHTASEFKWGGAKHHPERKDDGGKMHPRSSFKAFLEVVKSRSIPWEISEINAIHSLQLIMRDSIQEIEDAGHKPSASGEHDTHMKEDGTADELSSVACEMVRLIETATAPIFGVDSSGFINGWNAKIAELTGLQASEAMGKSLINEVVHEDSRQATEALICRALQGEEDRNIEVKLKTFGQHHISPVYIVVNACMSRDYTNSVVGVCFVGQDVTPEKVVMDKFIRLQGDYESIIQSLDPLIPPIFASDKNACCSEWNVAMEKITGWSRAETIGKMLPGEVFGGLCNLKDRDTLTQFMILLHRGFSGHAIERFPFGFYDRKGEFLDVQLTVNKRIDAADNIVGCFCFLQILPSGVHLATEGHETYQREYHTKMKELAYIKQEMRNSLNGIQFTHKLLESTATSDDQKKILMTSNACERQIMTIIEDLDFGSIEGGDVQLKQEDFLLENVVDAVISQAMILVNEKKLRLVNAISHEVGKLSFIGDQSRLQLVLSDFLLTVVRYAPSDGWVEISVSPGLKRSRSETEFLTICFRLAIPGPGIPPAVIEDMIQPEIHVKSQEGLGLNIARKLLMKMNGQVHYIREQNRCYFTIHTELKLRKDVPKLSLRVNLE